MNLLQNGVKKNICYVSQLRVTIGVTLFILVGLFSTIQLNNPADQIFKKFAGISKITPNELQGLFEQARSLKKELPPFGWAHFDTDDRIYFERNTILEHALAPLIFDNNPSRLWWIGRYASPISKAKAITKFHLNEIREVGHGLVVLKRKEP